ncbi:hypothetical protein [Oligoflexus tunisiensis]|uniref:hypothetical protein n=1 Tax=Oligoflexus tunisiensis TaxID=708132 RepID=UPI001C4088A1|nr:hypothetical protein [Oligoflexus tunisiensis]
MNFDPGFIMLAAIFSGLGFVYFHYGRKQAKIMLIVIGLVLMVYPYFLDSKIWLVVWGLVLSFLPRLL